jgi:hypothetical protein
VKDSDRISGAKRQASKSPPRGRKVYAYIYVYIYMYIYVCKDKLQNRHQEEER